MLYNGCYIRGFYTRSFQLVEAIESRVRGQPAGLELDMISWIGRTALELIGQAGLGYSFDPLVADTPDDFGYAIKTFQYVLSLSLKRIAGVSEISMQSQAHVDRRQPLAPPSAICRGRRKPRIAPEGSRLHSEPCGPEDEVHRRYHVAPVAGDLRVQEARI